MVPDFSTFASLQAAIRTLLDTRSPVLLAAATYRFWRLAVVLIIIKSIQAMGRSGDFHARFFDLFQTLMYLTICGALLRYYLTPIPGVGTSFGRLIPDAATWMTGLIEDGAIEKLQGHVMSIYLRVELPGVFGSIQGWAMFLALYVAMLACRFALIFIIGFSLVASAVCSLLGPAFIAGLALPQTAFLFTGWIRAQLQFSFVSVIAVSIVAVAEQFLSAYALTMPPYVGIADYGIWILSSAIMIATVAGSLFAAPMLTRALFSGAMAHASPAAAIASTALFRR